MINNINDAASGEEQLEKRALREKHLKLRKNIGRDERSLADENIFRKIKVREDIEKADNIMLYSSGPDEAGTRKITEYLISAGKKVYLPSINDKDLFVRRIRSMTDLVKGKFGILEPRGDVSEPVEPGILDIVIVPGVCFTRRGARLGRGKGYYDRFLSRLPERVKVIGICYSSQIEDNIPCTDNDMEVDEVVTD
ncbi:MAG: 5-formyltetrahydrofolate cyclo-ligase [Elusimicrobia bacterium]|nr:5-formyltetrahydrofolate cyclo-ligase [Elusimicrobiota bacterium]